MDLVDEDFIEFDDCRMTVPTEIQECLQEKLDEVMVLAKLMDYEIIPHNYTHERRLEIRLKKGKQTLFNIDIDTNQRTGLRVTVDGFGEMGVEFKKKYKSSYFYATNGKEKVLRALDEIKRWL